MCFPDRFFIAGTDTGVGKTVISAILLAGLGYTYWKPVQSGLEEGIGDTEVVRALSGLPVASFMPEAYRLRHPASPHISSAAEGLEIEMANLGLPDYHGQLLVEGAGGLMVPLNDTSLMLDLIKMLGLPVLLVARSGLGTINHTLLSLEALRNRQIEVLGVVLNGERDSGNRKAIEHYGTTGVVAQVEPLAELSPQSIKRAFYENFSPVIDS